MYSLLRGSIISCPGQPFCLPRAGDTPFQSHHQSVPSIALAVERVDGPCRGSLGRDVALCSRGHQERGGRSLPQGAYFGNRCVCGRDGEEGKVHTSKHNTAGRGASPCVGKHARKIQHSNRALPAEASGQDCQDWPRLQRASKPYLFCSPAQASLQEAGESAANESP